MNEEQFAKLQTGDVVINVGSKMQYHIIETNIDRSLCIQTRRR